MMEFDRLKSENVLLKSHNALLKSENEMLYAQIIELHKKLNKESENLPFLYDDGQTYDEETINDLSKAYAEVGL